MLKTWKRHALCGAEVEVRHVPLAGGRLEHHATRCPQCGERIADTGGLVWPAAPAAYRPLQEVAR